MIIKIKIIMIIIVIVIISNISLIILVNEIATNTLTRYSIFRQHLSSLTHTSTTSGIDNAEL